MKKTEWAKQKHVPQAAATVAYNNPSCTTVVINRRTEETKIASFYCASPCSPSLATVIHKNMFHPCSLLRRLKLYQEVLAIAKTQQEQRLPSHSQKDKSLLTELHNPPKRSARVRLKSSSNSSARDFYLF